MSCTSLSIVGGDNRLDIVGGDNRISTCPAVHVHVELQHR